ncbi:5-oxoprolinase/urea amidolyase family protein [Leucobacter sp. W1153]|uniref:5-oxoprolinase subunit B/C family protein n=1 Tax=Leucobacter sp. W1153 TaxID=3439064 RepID=UPI003F318D14
MSVPRPTMAVTQLRIRRAGTRSVLLDCGDLESALHVLEALVDAKAAGDIQADEFVSAAETVLIRGGDACRPELLGPKLRTILDSHGSNNRQYEEVPKEVIPVDYSGPDLAEVAELTGLSIDEVIRRHTQAEYTVAFTGFAPGFAYLAGGDESLVVPRRTTPRLRIEAGSVSLADNFTGIYPRESPGGWQVIGRTRIPMWDLGRTPPALLRPGGRVRFTVDKQSILVRSADRADAAPQPTPPKGFEMLRVVEPGLQPLIEDLGRPNLADLGVSASGAADRSALKNANRAVGNDANAPGVELGLGTFSAQALRTGVMAVCGAPRRGSVTGPLGTRQIPYGRAFRVDAGETITLALPERGLRTVLALRGGIQAPRVLGSASRDTLAGMGPNPLAAGDVLLVGEEPSGVVGLPVDENVNNLPSGGTVTALRVVPGPRDSWFSEEGLHHFWQSRWEVSPRSDRVGVRLSGEPIARAEEYAGRELPSEGLANGAIQVPSDGQPVLFLVDRPLTGGYPVIGVVCEEDLDMAAQLPPGAFVRFIPYVLASDENSVCSSHEGELS